MGHALDWHQHVMDEDQLQILCPGTTTSDSTAIDNSTATTSSAAGTCQFTVFSSVLCYYNIIYIPTGPLIAALAALVSLAVVD